MGMITNTTTSWKASWKAYMAIMIRVTLPAPGDRRGRAPARAVRVGHRDSLTVTRDRPRRSHVASAATVTDRAQDRRLGGSR
jgi:hypothetical protein